MDWIFFGPPHRDGYSMACDPVSSLLSGFEGNDLGKHLSSFAHSCRPPAIISLFTKPPSPRVASDPPRDNRFLALPLRFTTVTLYFLRSRLRVPGCSVFGGGQLTQRGGVCALHLPRPPPGYEADQAVFFANHKVTRLAVCLGPHELTAKTLCFFFSFYSHPKKTCFLIFFLLSIGKFSTSPTNDLDARSARFPFSPNFRTPVCSLPHHSPHSQQCLKARASPPPFFFLFDSF